MRRSVVFTGKGLDTNGRLRTRPEWEALANAKGFTMDAKVRMGTKYLVASLDNTKKAQDARMWGVEVISYSDFEAMLRGAELTPNTFNQAPPPPIDMVGMEEIPGWGSF